LTRFYGLKPWDFDRMTLREVSEYRVHFEKCKARATPIELGG